jgi:DNA mismatch repair ATPase MutS
MTVNIISKEEESKLLNNSFLSWQNIKSKYVDAIMLVRYENEYYAFDSDAEIVSTMSEIKPEQDNERITCHLPHHYTDWLLPKLVKAGYRVALCEPLYFKADL